MHRRRLLRVGRNKALRDRVFDLLLDERRDGRRERASDMIRHVGAQKKTLNFGGEILTRL